MREPAAQGDSPPLKALIAAANKLATSARNLLTITLVAALTLGATMVAPSDESLLKDVPEVFLRHGVKAKLSYLYLMAPPAFVFMHINALLKMQLLARRLRAIEEEMARSGLAASLRDQWRHLIHGFAFAQILLRGKAYPTIEKNDPFRHSLLLGTAWFAIAFAPLILLITIQLGFIRYQSPIITQIHQWTLTVDLAVLSWFSWKVLTPPVDRNAFGIGWFFLCSFAATFLLWLSWFQAVPPSPQDDPAKIRWTPADIKIEHIRGRWFTWALSPSLYVPIPDLLKDPNLKDGANLLDRWSVVMEWKWTRRYLDLSYQTLPDPMASPKPQNDREETAVAPKLMAALDLESRSFLFAIFKGTSLTSANLQKIQAEKSDWTGATLKDVILDGANLRHARFDGADMNRVTLVDAKFRQASLKGAKFWSSKLMSAQFHGAILDKAEIHDSDLSGADIRGATLAEARLADVSIEGVQADSAIMRRTIIININGRIANCNNIIITYRDKSDIKGDIIDRNNIPCYRHNESEFNQSRANDYYDRLCSAIIQQRPTDIIKDHVTIRDHVTKSLGYIPSGAGCSPSGSW